MPPADAADNAATSAAAASSSSSSSSPTAAGETLARVSRMRKLSALLDDELDDDAELPAEALALFAPRSDAGAESEDAEMASMLEQTRRNEFLCVECRAHDAEVFCEQCHDYFCELCFGGQHRKGNRRKHTFQPRVAPAAADASAGGGAATPSASAAKDAVDYESDELEDGEVDEDDDSDDDNGSSTARGRAGAGDACSSASSSPSSSPTRHSSRRNICNLMGNFLLGVAYPVGPRHLQAAPAASASAAVANPKSSLSSLAIASTMLERAKYIPVRLTYEERKLLRTLEAALRVSSYTDKLDTAALVQAPAKRARLQLQDICGFLSGLAVSADYKAGQEVLDDKNFGDHAEFFQDLFELGRRYKIMNPEKLRGEYGKLMYLLQDACSPEIRELLGFSCLRNIRTVYDVLRDARAVDVLRDPQIEVATMVVAPENKSRAQIQRQIKQKENAIRAISDKYSNRAISRDGIQQCLYSIADNNYHLYFERDPIDRMIALLTKHFSADSEGDGPHSLAIVSGNDGARLSHSHSRQFHYVLQSLTLWREIAHDMFRLWYLTDADLLGEDDSSATEGDDSDSASTSSSMNATAKYSLEDTGQGLHRVQAAPRVSRAMHVILHSTQRRLDSWVGSSVIHLGDKNVPNALMFIDKYTQVGHILRPIVKTVDSIDALAGNSSSGMTKYIEATFGGPAKLKKDILADFFREAFDGSGADNFFEAGSCIDGRLTSAWNWCSNLHKKHFFPVFKLAGFVGFDGKFG